MKILITGNMGYVGPSVASRLRAAFPGATLIGYDTAYYASCLTNADSLPERKLDVQLFGDVRNLGPGVLAGVDAVVHLAAISNDPMGHLFEEVTMEINYESTVRIAKMAKEAGARTFIFASSCSMYGASDGSAKTESSELNPLTAYARSKVLSEKGLMALADTGFMVTCLRFATACGMSERLRLDLVLNDFVAGAVASGKIEILSDGTPWRPLIHIKDMARAIEWAITRQATDGGEFLAVNAGSNEWNYNVLELAESVASVLPGTEILLNEYAPPDKRSYRVNFSLFESLAPHYQPLYTLKQTIRELYAGLVAMDFKNTVFRDSPYMRLKVLTRLREIRYLNSRLEWTDTIPETFNYNLAS